MHPADFYNLARHDRERAARHLLCYDGPGLRHFAVACARHLAERFGVEPPPEQVLTVWQRVGLLHAAQAETACGEHERTVGR